MRSKKKTFLYFDDEQSKKCSPNRNFEEDNTCFTLEELKIIATAFNNYHQNNSNKFVNINGSKKEILEQLTNQIKNCNNNQICWLNQPFFSLVELDILNKSHRPLGPQGKFTWLSTTNINEVLKQYEHKYDDFYFLGAVPMNFDDLNYLGIKNLNFTKLINNNKFRIGIVFNLDESWKSGSHWVALYFDLKKKKIYYFDSYGENPDHRVVKFIKRIENFMNDNKFYKNKYNNIKVEIKYNQLRHQYGNSECGVYSINFILRLLKGESFEEINSQIIKDSSVNKCRNEYFILPDKN